MVIVAGPHGHRRQVFANLHLPLELRSLHLLTQQLILRSTTQRLRKILTRNQRNIGINIIRNREIIIGKTAILAKKQLQERDTILQFKLLGSHVALAQLHLQKVIPHSHTSLYGNRDILVDIGKKSLHRLNSLGLLLQGNQLPEIILSGL